MYVHAVPDMASERERQYMQGIGLPAGMSNSNTQRAKIKHWNKVTGQTRYLLKY